MEEPTTLTNERPATFVQRHFLWLLLACYGLATIWPDAGLAMHGWKTDVALANGGQVTFQLMLLAWMLFCAALTADVGQVRCVLSRPLVLIAALAAVWAGPGLLVVIASWLLPRLASESAANGLLMGLALVATMPVANSSVGWVQNARGNLALGLGLVVLSISLSPWITPQLLAIFGKTLSPEVQAQCEQLINSYSGWFFVVWVISPTVLGLAVRQLATPRRVESASSGLAISSAAALLLLNYISSSLALPKASHAPPSVLLLAALLAVGLSAVGLAFGWGLAFTMRLPAETRAALLFGLSMKNTGLALVLTEAELADKKYIVLLIVLTTLAQHILAGMVQWRQWHRGD